MLASSAGAPIVLTVFVALPAVCVVSILLLRSRFHVVSVFGLSMYPYLNAGDRVIIERRPDRCGRGDVVLIVSPGWPGQVIKRIAAVGGDRFPCDAGVVPPGHVFVLGDNLEASVDSRHFGFVPVERVVGRVIRRLAL